MAYSVTNLRRKNYGAPLSSSVRPISEWSYVTADTAATVETAAYFNTAYNLLSKGDVIEAVMVMGGTPVAKRYVVTASSSTAVTIALQTTTAG